MLLAWVGVIFCSSTSFAGTESEQLFSHLSELFLPELQKNTSSYETVHFLADKSVHVGLVSILGMLLWKVLSNSRTWQKIAPALLVGAIVGSCSELLQSFFPGRDPAVTDVLINIGGTAMGIALSIAFGNRQRSRVDEEMLVAPEDVS